MGENYSPRVFVTMYVIFPKTIFKPSELIQKLNEKHQTVGTVPKSKRKIVEREEKVDIPNRYIWLVTLYSLFNIVEYFFHH